MILSKIRALFIPEKIGDYYLVAQRIVSVEISPTGVKAVLVKAQGRNRTIEKTIEKSLSTQQKLPSQELSNQIIEALKNIKSEVKKYDQLYAIIPSNLCVLKELVFPAATSDRVKALVPFEIESTLPFSLSEATIASIIMGTRSDTIMVLACAIKNSILADHLSLYYEADMAPTRVTIDMIELYTLYSSVENLEIPSTDLLVYSDKDVTRLGVIQNGYLTSTRVIPQGLLQFATSSNSSTLTEEEQPQALAQLLSSITFTLQAAQSKKAQTDQRISMCTLVGPISDYPVIKNLLEQATNIPCRTLMLTSLLAKNFKQKIIIKKTSDIADNYIIPLSTALALPLSRDFNLHTIYSENEESAILTRQLVALVALALLTLGTVIGLGWWRVRKLNQEISASETEAINRLKKEFPNLRSSKSLDAVKNAAAAELVKEKSIWFALSPQKRASFLRYLQELSTQLNTQELGLTLSQLIFDEDSITLEGEVKDYEALKHFEQLLRRSKLFSAVPRFEDLKFSTRIPLDKATGELS